MYHQQKRKMKRRYNTKNVLMTERLLAQGRKIKEIARELDVNPRSVYRYRKMILEVEKALAMEGKETKSTLEKNSRCKDNE